MAGFDEEVRLRVVVDEPWTAIPGDPGNHFGPEPYTLVDFGREVEALVGFFDVIAAPQDRTGRESFVHGARLESVEMHSPLEVVLAASTFFGGALLGIDRVVKTFTNIQRARLSKYDADIRGFEAKRHRLDYDDYLLSRRAAEHEVIAAAEMNGTIGMVSKRQMDVAARLLAVDVIES